MTNDNRPRSSLADAVQLLAGPEVDAVSDEESPDTAQTSSHYPRNVPKSWKAGAWIYSIVIAAAFLAGMFRVDGLPFYSWCLYNHHPSDIIVAKPFVQETLELLGAPPGVRIAIADDLPIIQGHETLLQQVIANLLSNAFKHGCRTNEPHSHVCISAQLLFKC